MPSAQKRLNLTKTVRKLPIHQNLERGGFYQHDDLSSLQIKYDDHIPVHNPIQGLAVHLADNPGHGLHCLAPLTISGLVSRGLKTPTSACAQHNCVTVAGQVWH